MCSSNVELDRNVFGVFDRRNSQNRSVINAELRFKGALDCQNLKIIMTFALPMGAELLVLKAV